MRRTDPRRTVVLIAALASLIGAAGACARAAAASAGREDVVTARIAPSPPRPVLFVGGETLAAWKAAGSPLFTEPGAHVLVAPDGRIATMLLRLRGALDAARPAAVHVLPDPVRSDESVAELEQQLGAIVDVARAAGARVVLARPLQVGGRGDAARTDALAAWMQRESLERGLEFGDYRAISFGRARALDTAADLRLRDESVRSALDGVFVAEPGVPAMERFRRRMVEDSARPDTPGTGPYPAVRSTDPAFPDLTLYRPLDLSPFATARMPVVVWGNGGCADDGSNARPALAEIASHGYFVIALGSPQSGPGATARPRPVDPTRGLATTLKDMQGAIDRISKAPETREWRKVVDAGRIAVAGWSCGGLLALGVSADPRVRTTVVVHSGTFADESVGIPGLIVTKAQLQRLRAPVLYVLGGPTDVAYANGVDDFQRIDRVPATLVSSEFGHGGTLLDANGGPETRVIVEWLAWRMRDDERARRFFVGEGCGLCDATGWTVANRGN